MDSSISDLPFVLAIGDSHCKFWSGQNTRGAVTHTHLPRLRILHLGPVTAHNINEETASTGGKTRLIRKLTTMKPVPTAFIVSMGEIDCRTHLVKAALFNKSSILDAVRETVDRYVNFLDWITKHYGRPVVAWGPGPSSPPDRIKFNPKFPVVGSAAERNYATYLFNEILQEKLAGRSQIGFATQFDHLIDSRGHTLPNALFDGVHVDSAHFQDAAIRVRSAFKALGRSDVANLLLPWTISNKQQIVDISESAQYTAVNSEVTVGRPCRASDFFPIACGEEGIQIDLMAGYSIKMVELPVGGEWIVQGAENPLAMGSTRLQFMLDQERSEQRGSSVYVPEPNRRLVRFLWLVPYRSWNLSKVGILVRSFGPGTGC